MKILKVLLGLVALVVGAVLAVGFLSEPSFDDRHEFVIDAPIAKVWSVVSDPKQVPGWMPVHEEKERIVEVKAAPGALETASPTAEQVAKTGDVDASAKKPSRHTYVHQNGTETTVEVVERTANRKIMERVVADTTGMAGMFPEMSWGFELADAEGGKTRLTPFMVGRAAKPHGTFMHKLMAVTGMSKGFQEQMAKNIETLAKSAKTAP